MYLRGRCLGFARFSNRRAWLSKNISKNKIWGLRRLKSTMSHAEQYANMLAVEEDAQRIPTRVNINYLLSIERHLSENYLLDSANHLREELRIRLAHRIRDLQQLPYIVGLNPHIREVYDLYMSAFSSFRRFKHIDNLKEEQQFVKDLSIMVESHNSVVYILGLAVPEIRQYMPKEDLTTFLDRMLVTRISRRVIAEQHIAFHRLYYGKGFPKNFIGIFDTKCSPQKIINRVYRLVSEKSKVIYSAAPELKLDGDMDATFTYVPIHLETIFTELLKNAVRATVEFSPDKNNLPPIQVTIAKGQHEITIRIRDLGGGIPKSKMDEVWDYSYTTEPKIDSKRQMSEWSPHISSLEAGPGFGLPMVHMYSSYFGGSTTLCPLHGLGCDVFVKLSTALSSKECSDIL